MLLRRPGRRRWVVDIGLAGALLALQAFAVLLLGRLARLCGEGGARRGGARRGGARRALVSTVAIALPLAVLWPWLMRGRTLLPTDVLAAQLPGLPVELRASVPDAYATQLNDVVLQLAPWEREVRRAFGERRWPFWSDTLEGGSNLWGNPQAGVLSPVALLARLLPWRAFLLAGLTLKMAVALSGAALLARRLGARAPAALFAGLTFALGGAIFAWALFPLSTTVAWVPWFAAALLRQLRRPSPGALAATAATGAALLLSGHPESAFGGALFAVVLALAGRRRRAGGGRRLLLAALGCALAVGLAAPAILPFLALVPQSQRLQQRLAATAAPASGTAITGSSKLGDLAAMVVDGNAFGRPYASAATLWPVSAMPFCGRAAALLALAGATVARRRRALPLALLLVWVLLLLAAPDHPVPGILAVPATNRFLPVADLAFALAAALGLEALQRLPKPVRERLLRLLLVGAILAAAGWWLAPRGGLLHSLPWLAVTGLAGAALGGRWRHTWPLLVCTAAELALWDRALLPRGDARLFFPETPFLRQVAAVAARGGDHRATGLHYLVPASLLPVYGVADIRPHNPLAPRGVLRPLHAAFGFAPDAAHYFSPLQNLDHPLLSFLDVGAVVSKTWLPQPATLRRVARDGYGDDVVSQNPRAVGRLFVPTAAEAVADPDLEAWLAALADPRRVAIAPDKARRGPVALADGAAVAIVRWARGDVTARVSGAGDRLLASSLPGPAGWRAEDADGSPLATLAIDGGYLGVRLPSGVSTVRLRFRPPGLLAGAALATGAATVLALAAWRRRRVLQGFAGSE